MPRIRRVLGLLLVGIVGLLLWQGTGLLRTLRNPLSQGFVVWRSGDSAERRALITQQQAACIDAPFILPAEGFIGLLYADPRGPYSSRNPHQGIDIFSDQPPGITPVYAAYDGYITRQSDWTSTLIQRVPDDPLRPGEQIWLYYTHMADRDGNDFIVDAFPRGTREQWVPRGTLLGYVGDYNGNSARSIWTHLHFSIVRDDGRGRYLNELQFENTLDPSPYLGLQVGYGADGEVATCAQSE